MALRAFAFWKVAHIKANSLHAASPLDRNFLVGKDLLTIGAEQQAVKECWEENVKQDKGMLLTHHLHSCRSTCLNDQQCLGAVLQDGALQKGRGRARPWDGGRVSERVRVTAQRPQAFLIESRPPPRGIRLLGSTGTDCWPT